MGIGISKTVEREGPSVGTGADRTRADAHNRGGPPAAGEYPTAAPTYDSQGRHDYLDKAFQEASDKNAAMGPALSPLPPRPAALSRQEAVAAQSMRERIAAMRAEAYARHSDAGPAACNAVRSRIDGVRPTGAWSSERQALLDLADVLADSAGLDFASNAHAAGSESIEWGKTALNLATDFVPGVSLAKDIASLVTGKNIVTGEELSAADKGFLVAGLVTPGALKNGIKHVAKAGQLLSKVAQSGKRSAPKAAALLRMVQDAERLTTRYAAHIDEGFASSAVQAIAQKWGQSAGGFNQLLAHTAGKLDKPNRLLRIEELATGSTATVQQLLEAPSSDLAKRTFLLFDRAAHEAVAYGERHISRSNPKKVWYHKAVTEKRGVAVVVYDDKLQSVMPMKATEWVKTKVKE